MASTTINGRTAVDRAGVADLTGAGLSTVDHWYTHRETNEFPERIPGTRYWYAEDIAAFKTRLDTARLASLTDVDRTGDPDELVKAPEAARILGYVNRDSLSNSSVWPKLLERVDVDEPLPSGRRRRKWHRSTVWTIADEREGHGSGDVGRPSPLHTGERTIDRTGDPDELVGASEAARVLGYSSGDKLPDGLRARADETTTGPSGRNRRQWRRRTLWAFQDELAPGSPS